MPRVELTIQLTLTPGEALHRLGEGLALLVAEGGLGFQSLMRQVIAETLLQAYRRRFYQKAKTGLLHKTERSLDTATGGEASPEELAAAQERVADLVAQVSRIQHARGALQAAELTRIGYALSQAYQRLHLLQTGERLPGDTGGEHGTLSTGKYRDWMVQLVETLLNPAFIDVARSDRGDLAFLIGGPSVQDWPTPSWTEQGPRHGVSSARQHDTISFLRQLEWGTGVFAQPESRQGGSEFKVGTEWWYGQVVGAQGGGPTGIKLRGTRGAHFLKQASGVPYEQDAIHFEFVLHEALTAKLLGLR